MVESSQSALNFVNGSSPASAYHDDAVAIVGMGCRYPGAGNPAEFWRLLEEERDVISEVPPDRWNVNDFYDPNPLAPGKMNTRWGGFLEDIDKFDPYFFGISPREAACMDPQQRLLLEVAWEAMEDGGQVAQQIAGTPVGVFIGLSSNDYGRSHGDLTAVEPYMGPGNANSIAANRLSYVFDFRGPSMTVDTACSSSLVAVHLACASLHKRECSLALAGGVNVILSPGITVAFTKAGMMSPDGRCKAFDAGANGYVRGEGVGVVVLKPLPQAIADGDAIYAVILGTASNQDGRSNGLTAPNRQSQEAVIRAACRDARVWPGQLDYVEAHGTGTALGDAIESRALGNVLAEGRQPGSTCAVGSVKTNIGHLESAAGIASLMKVALSLKHRRIPASLHFETPNPLIRYEDVPIRVQTRTGVWPNSSALALAGVNSFGFGGTNAHIILGETPRVHEKSRQADSSVGLPHLLPISAHSEEALRSLAERYRAQLRQTDAEWLRDACYSSGARRSHHEYRLAITGRTASEMAGRLDHFLEDRPCPGVFSGRARGDVAAKVAFVFPGQGTRLHGAGRQLMEVQPLFRRKLEECDELFRVYQSWSIVDEIRSGVDRLDQTEFAQPVTFALQTALAAFWQSLGVNCSAVLGHSLGEIAAAHCAGALGLEDAVRIVYHRARLMQKAAGLGKMAAVHAGSAQVAEWLAAFGGRVSIAACNTPELTVLSGETSALAELLASPGKAIRYEYLTVNYAFHSEQMAPFQQEFLRSIQGFEPRSSSIAICSTLSGEFAAGDDLDAAYWWNNIRQTVMFSAATDTLIGRGFDTFLEISAHPTLLACVGEGARDLNREVLLLSSLRQGTGEPEQISGTMARLYVSGRPVAWRRLQAGGSQTTLPPYPWKHEPFWHPAIVREGTPRIKMQQDKHPLLGWRLATAQPMWENSLELSRLPYLSQHRVQGAVVYPAAAYLEAVLASAARASDSNAGVVSNVRFERPLVLPETGACKLQTILSPAPGGAYEFSVYGQADPTRGAWHLHASGLIEPGGGRTVAPDPDFPGALIARCHEEIEAADFYQGLREIGLEYGPAFQAVGHIWRGEGEALARISPPESIASDLPQYRVHPAVLDACGQVLLALARKQGELLVPSGIDVVRVYTETADLTELWVHASVSSADLQTGFFAGNARLLDQDGNLIAEVEGLRLQAFQNRIAGSEEHSSDWLYETQWREMPPLRPGNAAAQDERWLVLADPNSAWESLVNTLATPVRSCVILHAGEQFRRVAGDANRIAYQIRPGRIGDFAAVLDNEFLSQGRPCAGVVHLWSLASGLEPLAAVESLRQAQTLGVLSVTRLVQEILNAGLEPRVWLVTNGAQYVDACPEQVLPAQAPLWGLCRVIANEHPELRCSAIDLPAVFGPEDLASLAAEVQISDTEDQIAWREGRRYAPRLTRVDNPKTESENSRRPAPVLRPFRIAVSAPGNLDSLEFADQRRAAPGPEEIEIEVHAAALNFRDVLKALGIYPGADETAALLGDECSGTVVAAGEKVEQFRTGDQVVALASGCLAKYVTTSAHLAYRKPAHLSFEEAASVPVVFLTAYYALHHLARLEKGERILIHAAAGGVGLAAVQLAQQAGAEIFATAGSQEKRDFLRALGITHVFDSRSLGFAAEILRVTGGKGVDVVLNSLAGPAIGKSLSVLAPYGRFLEIGKRDIYENSKIGLRPFQNNLSFHAIDMEKLVRERPRVFVSLFRELMGRFAGGTLQPIALRTFGVSEVVPAFRHLAQALNVGKVVMTMSRSGAGLPALDPMSLLRPDRTYLITGGLGQLGSLVARWMIERGARNLALLARSLNPTQFIEELRAPGICIGVIPTDVADPDSVHRALELVRNTMPELAGVVHAAGVLQDSLLLQLDEEKMWNVLAPKVLGARNLHAATLHTPLDFFILFSSVSAIFGTPGQANYAAGNAFLDALAQHRRQRGLPAISINWGPWDEVGMAATGFKRNLIGGIRAIPPALGLDLFEEILRSNISRPVVASFEWPRWLKQYGSARNTSLFSDFQGQAPALGSQERISALRKKLNEVDTNARKDLIASFMAGELARVLQVEVSRIDVNAPLDTVGLDSLMAVEYKTRLEYELGFNLPIVRLLNGPRISEVAAFIADAMVPRAATREVPPAAAVAHAGRSTTANRSAQESA